MDVIRDDFDRIAAAGGDGLDQVDPRAIALVEAWPPGGRVLEIGCGAGALTRHLAARAAAVVGLDLSPAMVARARATTAALAHVSIVEADFETWDPEPARFDGIVSVATLHHLPLEPTLRLIAGLLAPGGRLAIVDLFATRLRELPYHLVAFAARRLRPRAAVSPAVAAAWARHAEHDHHLSLPELRRRVAAALPTARVRRHLDWRYSLTYQATR